MVSQATEICCLDWRRRGKSHQFRAPSELTFSSGYKKSLLTGWHSWMFRWSPSQWYFGLSCHCLDLEGFDAEGEFDGAGGRTHNAHLLAWDLQLVLLQATWLRKHEAFKGGVAGSCAPLWLVGSLARVGHHVEGTLGWYLSCLLLRGHFDCCLDYVWYIDWLIV